MSWRVAVWVVVLLHVCAGQEEEGYPYEEYADDTVDEGEAPDDSDWVDDTDYEAMTDDVRPDTCTTRTAGWQPAPITSRNYPEYYPHNEYCTNTIYAEPGQRIYLQIVDFATESCCDRMEVRDGSHSSARMLGQFKGSNYSRNIVSSGNSMYILFRSDGSVSNRGFSAYYSISNGSEPDNSWGHDNSTWRHDEWNQWRSGSSGITGCYLIVAAIAAYFLY